MRPGKTETDSYGRHVLGTSLASPLRPLASVRENVRTGRLRIRWHVLVISIVGGGISAGQSRKIRFCLILECILARPCTSQSENKFLGLHAQEEGISYCTRRNLSGGDDRSLVRSRNRGKERLILKLRAHEVGRKKLTEIIRAGDTAARCLGSFVVHGQKMASMITDFEHIEQLSGTGSEVTPI